MRLFQSTRTFLAGSLAALVIGGAFFLGKSVGSAGTTELTTTQQTVILERIRGMGDLRTAEASFTDLVDHRSWRSPSAEWSAMPGVASLVRAGTENRHLVRATGKVEAGFDLSKARIGSTRPGAVTIILPPAHLKVRIEDAENLETRRAMFWRNDNGNLEALSQARASFLEAARSSGLQTQAESNAEKLLQDLLSPLGVESVTIQTESISSGI